MQPKDEQYKNESNVWLYYSMLEKSNWSCNVYKKGVGNNSILCTNCQQGFHKQCRGVTGSLYRTSSFLIHPQCWLLPTHPKVMVRPIVFCLQVLYSRYICHVKVNSAELDVGNRSLLERVDRFCYLGDMLKPMQHVIWQWWQDRKCTEKVLWVLRILTDTETVQVLVTPLRKTLASSP